MSQAQETSAFAAHYHAATYELAVRLAALDASGEWRGDGFRDCPHWLAIHAGFNEWRSRELIAVGAALSRLPAIARAFAAGQLSFDKVSALITVAQAQDEQHFLEIALASSATQLRRICTAFRNASVIDDPNRHARQQSERTFNAWWQGDGMLKLVALLPPEEGRLVLNAIEDAVREPAPARDSLEGGGDEPSVSPDALPEHPAHDPFGARRADALTRVCERWLAGGAAPGSTGRSPRQLVVHIDVETLLDERIEGRCHLEDGPAVAAALARRIGCESEVLVMLERGTAPLDLKCTQRVLTPRQRRALQLRDGYCRYPACRVPARDCDGHHITAWYDGGLTRLPNLLSLCAFHHQRYHEGAFQIVGDANAVVEFRTAGGTPIQPTHAMLAPGMTGSRWLRQLGRLAGRQVDADTPTATARGERCDLGYTVSLLKDVAERAAARASPVPSG